MDLTYNCAIGPGLPCDLDLLVDTRLLIQANSGGGKSWLLRRLLEQTHGRLALALLAWLIYSSSQFALRRWLKLIDGSPCF